LDDMIREHLVLETSRALGMRASDQELRVTVLSDPAFQNSGRFDKGLDETRLRQSGMVPAQFEDRLRQRLLATQLAEALVGTEVVTNRELDEALRLTGQKRDLSYLTLPAASFASDTPIPEEEIARYFEANAGRFQDPEQVKVEYLVLDAEQLPGAATPSDAKLREAYDGHPERFGQPERRRARHILLSVPSGADAAAEAQAKTGIEAARERIAKGEDFAAVAKEISQDPGTKTRGGDLGAFGRGVMDPAFEQAAFALDPGQVSEPVRSRFGYHLIETTEVLPASIKPFEEVKAQLTAEVGKQEVSSQFFDLSERLATLAYETPDSLAPAAEQLGLEIQTSDWIPRGGGQGVFSSPKTLNAAFSDDLVRQGVNSELIEPEKERMQAVVLRVLEHRDAAAKPLDQVRDEIVNALRTERAQAAALAEAKALQERLVAGAALAEIAGDFTLSQPGAVTRNEPKVPAAVRDVAFTLPRPVEGQAGSKPVSGVATLPDGAALVLVSAVTDGDPAATPEPARLQQGQSIARSIGSQAYQHLVEDLESRAKVERKPLTEGSNLE
ncbi:MAG TPA: peptidyl-prolyl cis-trans isomerase, partial [Chromatiaceae bacterium]|nr:peptidyl-prolyl cis-trans isomerase [Chromatiaceae bacterium]